MSSLLKFTVLLSLSTLTLQLPQASTPAFKPAPGNFPATGDDAFAGGIFCISLTDVAPYFTTGSGVGSEAPASGGVSSGSGPYPAQMTTDSTIPTHTVYAPKTPPNITMPFIAFGNGACQTDGAAYRNFLTEVASHGYLIIADGAPNSKAGGQTKLDDMRASIAWAQTANAQKYGKIDTDQIQVMGHSCGGLEGMSVAYHNPIVKHIVMLDIAIFQDNRRYLLQEIKVPVAYFIGGPKDMGYAGAEKDYALLNAGLPAYKANLDTGHGGTYSATNGGKFGKAVVAYLEWILRGDAKSKAICTDPKSAGSLVSDHWNVTYKNWT